MTAHDTARAIADVELGTILATVDIAVPPERVFASLTDPAQLVAWWGSDELYRTTHWEIDLRPGGKWRSRGQGADGSPFTVHGEFIAIEPPHKLVQTWIPDWDGDHVSTITYSLTAIEHGTRVTVRHEGLQGRPDACAGHAAGWERVLAWLGGHHARPASERHFLCRLLPPRATFLADMTPEEGAMMQEHAAYWRGKLGEGKVIVFGPVADPSGAWGLGVVRARDESELAAFEAADPAIRSGRGFRYEVLPMLQAVY